MAPAWLTARPAAHRGLHDAASGIFENTLPAAEAAIAAGFAIEIDVQLTADGEAVVFHDWTLDRLTDHSGPVSGLTATELSRLRVAGADATIPPLAHFLDVLSGRAPILIELKSRQDGAPDLVAAVARDLSGYDGPAAVMSFVPRTLCHLAHRIPGRPRGIVSMRQAPDITPPMRRIRRFARAHILHLTRTRPHFIAYHCRDLPVASIGVMRRVFRLPVLSWTVRSEAEAGRIRPYVDQIIFEDFRPETE